MAAPSTLVGREREVAAVEDLVRGLPGRGGALVLRGDPGVGKSSLLSLAVRQATECGRAVLRVTGLESEATVPFSGLHRLLGPVLPGVGGLPARQRDALLSAFGQTEPTEPYLVSYAALELVAEHAADLPVVLVVDDVHWLDPPTASALAFLARRIEYEPVVAVFAVRDGADSPLVDGSIPELVVPALGERQAAEVLDRSSAGLPATARHQILELAAGNPLALVELPKAWSLSDNDVLPHLSLTARLERSFARQIGALEDDVRSAALVAAANDTDDLAEVVQATEVLTGSSRGEHLLATAVAGGVLVVEDPKVHFRHPLIRAACYHGAPSSRRRAAHAALAEVLTTSAVRRTWHRAASTVGPAEHIAADLEAVAVGATGRGSAQVGVAALARAAELSASETERGRRLVAAAEHAFEAGLHAPGADLLRLADASDLAEGDRLRLSWLKEAFGDRSWSGATKVPAICDLARRLAEQGQRERALTMLLDVALRCWWSNPDADVTRTLIDTAEGLGADPLDPTLLTILGYGDPVERGRLVAERLGSFSPDSLHPRDALNLGTVATGIGAFPLAAPLLGSAASRFRARGEMGLLLQALVARVLTDYHLGRWESARAAGEEARHLSVDTAQPIWGMAAAATEALVAAAQGDEEGVDFLSRTAEAFFLPLGARTFLAPVEMARGLSTLSRGRHEQAAYHLRRVFEPGSPAYHRHACHWAVVDHVTAALALGRDEEARRAVESMESWWEVSGSPLLGASLLVTRALVADDDRAESVYREGVDGGLESWPFLHARHLLAYGTWLRRRRRARDSRPHLRASRDMFDALGTVPFYEQATRELRAAGEISRERAAGAGQRLSPQERHIAQLAADGLTNREIGQHLYLSHRTVGSHLYRIFPKLGITSRGQLRSALAGDATT